MTWSPTTEQILNLDGVRRRCDRFRFELCDREHRPIGDVHPYRTGSVPSIQNDASNNTSRRLTNFALTPDEGADVDTVKDRLRVYMVLQNGVEYLLGTFMWADDSQPLRSWGAEHHSELVDYTYVLDQETTQAFGWGKGASIVLIAIFLLKRIGFELKDLYPFGPESDRGLADPNAWNPGAHWIQMFQDMGNLIGFTSPWFDRTGRLHWDQIPNPAFDAPTVPEYDVNTRIVANSILYSNDLLKAPNDFGAFDSGPDRLRVGRYQLPASARHSFANRGFRIGATKSVQGMSSQGIADKEARNLARESDVHEYLQFTSTLDPRHDTHDIVPAFDVNWLETSNTMELRSGGAHTHTLKRVLYDVT